MALSDSLCFAMREHTRSEERLIMGNRIEGMSRNGEVPCPLRRRRQGRQPQRWRPLCSKMHGSRREAPISRAAVITPGL